MIRAGTKSVWSHVAFVMRLDAIDRIMVLESVEPLGVRTVPLSKYLTDYDSKGNPYPGRLAIARHDAFHAKASSKRLLKFGQFAVDLFGYPYDQDEVAKIAARIVASYLPFSAADKKALKRDREYICSEYVWSVTDHWASVSTTTRGASFLRRFLQGQRGETSGGAAVVALDLMRFRRPRSTQIPLPGISTAFSKTGTAY